MHKDGEQRQPVEAIIADFLRDLAHANHSVHIHQAYAADVNQFAAWYHGPLTAITPGILREFFATVTHLGFATRARKQAALARFLSWATTKSCLTPIPWIASRASNATRSDQVG